MREFHSDSNQVENTGGVREIKSLQPPEGRSRDCSFKSSPTGLINKNSAILRESREVMFSESCLFTKTL